jgi:hypothetical protein
MKLNKNVSNRTVTFSTVQNNTECTLDGQRLIKVQSKLGMTIDGKTISIPDFTLVHIKTNQSFTH